MRHILVSLITTALLLHVSTAAKASRPIVMQERPAAPTDSKQWQGGLGAGPLRLLTYPTGFISENLTRLWAVTGQLEWLPRMTESLVWEEGTIDLRPSLAIDGTFGLQVKRRSFLMKGALLRFSLESGDRFDTNDWRCRAHYTLKLDHVLNWLRKHGSF